MRQSLFPLCVGPTCPTSTPCIRAPSILFPKTSISISCCLEVILSSNISTQLHNRRLSATATQYTLGHRLFIMSKPEDPCYICRQSLSEPCTRPDGVPNVEAICFNCRLEMEEVAGPMEISDLTITSSPIVPPPTTNPRKLDYLVVSICSQPEQEMDPLVIGITSQLNKFWVVIQDFTNEQVLALEPSLQLSDEIQDFKLRLLPPSNLLHSFSAELVSNTLHALEGHQEELRPLARKRFRGELVRQWCCVCQHTRPTGLKPNGKDFPKSIEPAESETERDWFCLDCRVQFLREQYSRFPQPFKVESLPAQWMGEIAGFKCAVHHRCHSPWQFNYKVGYHPYRMCEAA